MVPQRFDEILEFAIQREIEAAAMYRRLADTVTRPGMREAFLDFAGEEERHRARLEEVKAGELPLVSTEEVRSLGISDATEHVEPNPGMTYADALRLAMQNEKEAYRMYMGLAAMSPPSLAAVFRSLAGEEARHKLRFEIEYDDHVLEGV